jgi:hypothetical protein
MSHPKSFIYGSVGVLQVMCLTTAFGDFSLTFAWTFSSLDGSTTSNPQQKLLEGFLSYFVATNLIFSFPRLRESFPLLTLMSAPL